MSDDERMRSIRGGHRGVVTKIVKEVDDLLSAEGPMNAERVSRLNVKLQQLEAKLKVLSDIDKEILSKCNVEDIEREINESETVTAKIMDCQQRIHEAIKPPDLPSAAPILTSGLTSNPIKPKLPKLTLPRFKGELTTWTTFWDSFKSAVHDNTNMSKIDKFSYPKSLLEGPASSCIQGLTLSEGNYDAAIAMLQERFGRPQQIITAHMDELLRIQGYVGDRPSSLRSIFDKIMVQVRGLESLGIRSAQYGSLLIPVIMSKFPNEIRLRVARETNKDVWDIDELLQIIRQEVEARETSEGTRVNPNRVPFHPPRAPVNHNPTTGSFITNGGIVRCVYCNGEHYSASCMRVVNVNDRKDILRKYGRCFNCLKPHHKSRDCDSRRTCRYCHRKHHQSICERPVDGGTPATNLAQQNAITPSQRPNSHTSPAQQNADGQPQNTHQSQSVTTSTCNKMPGNQVVLLQTATATAISGHGAIPVRVLLDNGSQLSYITTSLQSRLRLAPIRQERLHLNTFGSDTFATKACDVVQFLLQGPGQQTIEITACTSPVICSRLPALIDVTKYAHLAELELADDYTNPESGGIDVLIGSNYYWSVVTGEMVSGVSGPVAVNSVFGWLLSGPVNSSNNDVHHTHIIITDTTDGSLRDIPDDLLSRTLKQFWDSESIGIRDDTVSKPSDSFLPEIIFDGTRYEVQLPWRDERYDIPDHFHLCTERLKYLHQRLLRQPHILQEYSSIMNEQLSKGIIEAVDLPVGKGGNFEQSHRASVHYLPHHAVVRQDKQTTKVRIVYDGSARSAANSFSLNDCLMTGPNLIPKLFNILVRFRWNLVALTADIEKAFLMIGIHSNDRDVLRFLWFKEPYNPDSEVTHFRFTRLVFGLRPSPAILSSVISHHLTKYNEKYPELVKSIESSLYVDDLIAGEATVEEAFNLYKRAKSFMADGNFNLRKWNSNSTELLTKIRSVERQAANEQASLQLDSTSQEDKATDKLLVGLGDHSIESEPSKLLGIHWNSKTDEFLFCFSELITYMNELPPTRRSILKVSAKIFDPLGLISPFVIRLKVLFQTLCAQRQDWDEPLTGSAQLQWDQFATELAVLDKIRVPRCYFLLSSVPTNIQIHGFSDASEHAFAAVVYLRCVYEDGTITSRLVASKTRVSPVKKQSIPRLELLGALILARLANTILKSCSRKLEVVYWVDSMSVLFWIKNEKPWRQYVASRVSEIRQLTCKEQWRHCPGVLNPADLPSRGLTGDKLLKSVLWWEGPTFLQSSESEWPCEMVSTMDDVISKEIMKNPPSTTHVLTVHGNCNIQFDVVFNVARFSNLNFLLRVTARVFRFIKNLSCRSTNQEQLNTSSELGPEDLDKAEYHWIRYIQSLSFKQELQYLQGDHSHAAPIYVQQFGLFMDERGLLRCKGRINNSDLHLEQKNPILLPSKHAYIDLMIKEFHHRVRHSGINDTLVALREKYWIIRGRQAVKCVVKACVIRRRMEGPSYPAQAPADLPAYRVSDDPPFTHVGLDFAGPLYVKDGGHQSEECNKKAYICLFTCASTRAIHLELIAGLNVETFLLAFRRFISRRGLPATLMSDNAKTFKSASKDIRSITRSTEVIRYLTNQRTSWRFIVSRAPWWGGFWERMVRSVKRCLRKVIGKATLKCEELNTLLVEAESIINCRPLTYVYNDQEGISFALTPSHLIYGRRITTSPNATHYEIMSTSLSLTKRVKYHQRLLEQFTNRWKRDYLLSLREHHSLRNKEGQGPSVKVGDIVLLYDEGTKRAFWKLAVVNELIQGTDRKTRAAVIRIGSDKGPTRLLKRSIQHLIPIEVAQEDDTTEETENTTNDEMIENTDGSSESPEDRITETSTRLRRRAAVDGEALRRTWTKNS